MVARWCPKTDCAYLVANGRPVAAWVTMSPRRNTPEQTRAIGQAVAVGAVHTGLNFEHERAEIVVDQTRSAGEVDFGRRRRGVLHEGVEQLVDTEVQHRRGEQHRGATA